MKVKINEIITNTRIRKDLGNIMELAADIEENGQISPIAITTDKVLIAGGRRLAACPLLGRTEIEALVLEIREAEKLVQLEMAENIARKELTFSEKMSYAQKLEIIESEKARLRQEHRGEDAISGVGPNLDEAGRTAEIVGKACGIGGKDTYKKAKSIFESGDWEIIERVDKDEISIHKAAGLLKKPKPIKAKSPAPIERTDMSGKASEVSEDEIVKLKQQLQLEKDSNSEKEMVIRNLSDELQQTQLTVEALQEEKISDTIATSDEAVFPEVREELLCTDPIEICNLFIGKVEKFYYLLIQNTDKIEMSSDIRECINDCSKLLLRTVNDLKTLTGDNDGISKTETVTKTESEKGEKSKTTTKSMPKKKAKGKHKMESIKQSKTATKKRKTIVEKDKQTISEKSKSFESELSVAEGI